MTDFVTHDVRPLTPLPSLRDVVRSLPCSRCPEPTVVYLIDTAGSSPTVRLCANCWADRVALEQEMRA